MYIYIYIFIFTYAKRWGCGCIYRYMYIVLHRLVLSSLYCKYTSKCTHVAGSQVSPMQDFTASSLLDSLVIFLLVEEEVDWTKTFCDCPKFTEHGLHHALKLRIKDQRKLAHLERMLYQLKHGELDIFKATEPQDSAWMPVMSPWREQNSWNVCLPNFGGMNTLELYWNCRPPFLKIGDGSTFGPPMQPPSQATTGLSCLHASVGGLLKI